jgi:hypothetical protein
MKQAMGSETLKPRALKAWLMYLVLLYGRLVILIIK